MNITIYTNQREAQVAADRHAHQTGIDHLVIERFPAGPMRDWQHCGMAGEIMRANHRYTVLSPAEWAAVANDWDAAIVGRSDTPLDMDRFSEDDLALRGAYEQVPS